MPSYGYSLMCELYDPNELLAQAARAEAAGFDFVKISDHFHPFAERSGDGMVAIHPRVELTRPCRLRSNRDRRARKSHCFFDLWEQELRPRLDSSASPVA